jgi:hypothetical protein
MKRESLPSFFTHEKEDVRVLADIHTYILCGVYCVSYAPALSICMHVRVYLMFNVVFYVGARVTVHSH